MSDSTSASEPASLAALGALRSAPVLAGESRQRLEAELRQVLARCDWFTIGVMAPSAAAAVATLRRVEAALGWPPLAEQGDTTAQPQQSDGATPVFLKGNQRSGSFWLRSEAGLGEGVLISGHRSDGAVDASDVEGTWGPLPLDVFA